MTVKLIHKFFRKAREYERVYLERRKAGKKVESAVKHYRNYRCVLSEVM